MEVKVDLPFEELVSIVRQLSPIEKARLQQELNDQINLKSKTSSLRELLLTGPVFTEEQIETIEETRKSINEWRTKDF
jgi:hypothetical protein